VFIGCAERSGTRLDIIIGWRMEGHTMSLPGWRHGGPRDELSLPSWRMEGHTMSLPGWRMEGHTMTFYPLAQ